MLHIFGKGNQLETLFIFNILWWDMKYFMKNVSSTELHFLSHKPEQLHAECHFPILNCLCWFLFQVLPDCGVNRHKHEINFFRFSMPGSDALTLRMNKMMFWVSKGKKTQDMRSVCIFASFVGDWWATERCHKVAP